MKFEQFKQFKGEERKTSQSETERFISLQASAWDEVVRVLQNNFHNPDIQAARAIYSAVAAHALKGQPVWPMVVAPPGSMKTELIKALDGLPQVHSVDQVTSKTFLSGQIRDDLLKQKPDRPSSLLHRIGS